MHPARIIMLLSLVLTLCTAGLHPSLARAAGKKTGAPVTLALTAASARVEKVAVGDEITTSFSFTPFINADTMNVRVQAVRGLELLSDAEPSFTPAPAGERRQVDVRLRVLAPKGQIIIFFQTVTGREYQGQFQNVFYELTDGTLRVSAPGLQVEK